LLLQSIVGPQFAHAAADALAQQRPMRDAIGIADHFSDLLGDVESGHVEIQHSGQFVGRAEDVLHRGKTGIEHAID
jgi:hypothetical protein